MEHDVRWMQRFQNFDRAFKLLRSALEEKPLDEYRDLECEGIVQRFEYTFELAWKMIKDYLEETGVQMAEVTPRSVIKEAFAAKVIASGQIFIDMMLARNLLSHTYDFEKFREILKKVKSEFLPALEELHFYFLEKVVTD
ncbi:MAG: nucleotidyltransferase substrate binding protein [Clostridiales bacterium]|jgi:nucleotidyltransferase substrate binding protein (TIGR01987 family)|nr:nucleotidyltransferase substrate binding protein [Clostridiales bacterium]